MRRHRVPFDHLASLAWMVLLLLQVTVVAADTSAKNDLVATLLKNSLRIPPSHARTWRRRLEDADWNEDEEEEENDNADDDETSKYFNDDAVKNAENTFIDMFITSPNSWSALEWGVFAGLLTLFGVIFCCWCLVCIIPQCCGHRAAMAYAAMS